MSVLEFVQVLVSVILALGLAELLKGFADFFRAESAKPSAELLGLATWLTLLHVHFWWVGWRFRDITTWLFPELLLYLIGPIVLYVTARVLFPQDVEGVDLGAYYTRLSAKLWLLVALFFAYAVAVNVVLLGVPLLSKGPASQGALLVIALFARRARGQWVHLGAIALLFAQLVWRATQNVVGGG